MATLNQIKDFLNEKNLAIAGVSRDSKKFGHQIFLDLKKKGYTPYPINPNADVIVNDKCYKDVDDLPDGINHLFIVTPKNQTEEVIKKAAKKGIQNIWIQQMSETPECIAIANENNLNLITNECIHMFSEPVKGVHRFHRAINKIFQRYPKPA